MKRDPQTFAWNCENGVLKIVRRSNEKVERTYTIDAYPEAIRDKITDAGFKAVFQQRTSQIDNDMAKLEAWDTLDELFIAGTWETTQTRGAPVVAAWVEVLAQVKGVEVGAIQKALAGYSKEQREKMRANVEKQHGEKIAALQKARESTVDLSDLA